MGKIFRLNEIYVVWFRFTWIFPKAFWQSTGSNEIISCATMDIMEDLYRLLSGEKITSYVDASVILVLFELHYDELMANWSLAINKEKLYRIEPLK